MQRNAPRTATTRTLIAIVLALVTACSPEPPKPSSSPSSPTTDASPPPKVVGDLVLEACDPAGLLPCEQQAVLLTEPIAASGVALTYSTEWADGRLDRPTWNASTLGLGGWSLDVLQRYDPDRRILLSGDGSWRFADAADIGGGERAVPTYDGFRSFVFDADWRHVRTVDSITGATMLAIAYDAAGRLTGVSGARRGWPVSLTVERGDDGSLRYLTGPGEQRTTTSVGTDGLLAAIGRPDGTALNVAYAQHGLVASWQTTGRGFTTYTWDDAGRLAKATDPDGVWLEIASERADGSTSITVTDPNGGVATLRSERSGDVLRRTFTDTDRTVSQLDTNADGTRLLVEPDGTSTTVGVVPHPRWGLAAPMLTPVVERRPDGTEHRVEASTTMGTGSPAPAGGAWESSATIDGQRWVEAYDPATRTVTRTDPAGRVATQAFDADGRPTARRVPGEAPVTYSYDPAGVLATTTVGEGATAATTSYTYADGSVTELRPNGTTVTTRLDAFGRLRQASTEDEHVAIDHEPGGGMLQLRAGTHPATSFGFSEGGRQTAFLPPAVGADDWYELTSYTPAGQVSTISDHRGTRIEIERDEAGRATSWTFDEGTSTATYDASSGLLASNASPDGVTASFAYAGWVPTGIAWSGRIAGEVKSTVNGLLQATATSVNGGTGVPMGYDGSGLLASIAGLQIQRDPRTGLPTRSILGDVVTAFEYDESMRLVASTTTSAGRPVLAVRYVRDLLGRVTSVERTGANGDASFSAYGYDANGRLSSYQRDATSTSYAYDASGNRVSAIRGDSTTLATYDDRDRLTRQGGVAYRHSPDGTLLERSSSNGAAAYEFDDLGALRAVALPDGPRVEYVIDAGGRRIGRVVDGVLTDGYLYDVDDALVAWTDGSGHVRAQFAYDDTGRLALVRRDGRDLVVVTDQLGSPIAVLDGETGESLATMAYDAWGNVIGEAPTDLLPIGFAGGLVDPDTRLVHFGARDYDPRTGRWTAPDPLRYEGGDTNLYRYAHGDPVNLIDPTGTSSCLAGGCGGSAGGGELFRPMPMGGGRRGGSAGAGGASGGRSYHDHGPRGGSGGKGWHPKGPVSSAGGDNDNTVFPAQRPDRPPSGGNVGSYKNSFTTCIGSVCVREDRDGTEIYRGKAPGGPNANCVWGCAPALPGEGGKNYADGWCYIACGGNDPDGNDGFSCIFYCTYGEPHLVTADGVRLDFQAAGEFVVARSSDGAFEVQARYEPSRVVRPVTMTTALTTRIGGDRIGFYTDPDTGDTSRTLVINGQAIERAQYSVTLPGGGVVERIGADVRVTWPDGSKLAVEIYGKFMNFSMTPSDAIAASIVGVLGTRDGDGSNDLATRDGTLLDPESPDFIEQLYGPFADSWRIAQADSLFDYEDGETTDTFQLLDVPAEQVTVADLAADERAGAEALCRAMGVTSDPVLTACVFDVGMTGDPSFAASAATVAATIERANVPALDLGEPIAREQDVAGNLIAGATDRYHFTAAAGDIVYLDAGETCSPALSWRLMRPGGTLHAFHPGCEDIGRRVLPEAGEWLIEVYSDTGAAGPYEFRILSAPAPQVGTIAPGGSASGTTTAVGEWHRYTLEATAGQVVYLDAEATCDEDLSWRLIRPNGSLAWFATSCVDLGRRVLDEAGAWGIEVYADDLATGAYAFRVIDVPAPAEDTVSVGETVNGATTRIGEWYRYRLTATKGQVVYLDALGACAPGVSWRLLRPDATLSAFQTTCIDMGRRVLEVAGDWIVEIYADGLETGSYSFKVIGAPPVEERTIQLGRAVSGTVDAIGEWHRYRLTVDAGQEIVIDTTSDCVPDLWWRLLRPDGTLTTFASTCIDSDTRTLDVPGAWVIEIYSDVQATGPYAFRVRTP